MSKGYYQRHVFFCTNLRANGEACCQDHDARAARDYAKARIKALGCNGKGKVRINQAGCLDRCEQGPVIVVYPDETWYTYVDKSDLDEIIERHVLGGEKVERLMI